MADEDELLDKVLKNDKVIDWFTDDVLNGTQLIEQQLNETNPFELSSNRAVTKQIISAITQVRNILRKKPGHTRRHYVLNDSVVTQRTTTFDPEKDQIKIEQKANEEWINGLLQVTTTEKIEESGTDNTILIIGIVVAVVVLIIIIGIVMMFLLKKRKKNRNKHPVESKKKDKQQKKPDNGSTKAKRKQVKDIKKPDNGSTKAKRKLVKDIKKPSTPVKETKKVHHIPIKEKQGEMQATKFTKKSNTSTGKPSKPAKAAKR